MYISAIFTLGNRISVIQKAYVNTFKGKEAIFANFTSQKKKKNEWMVIEWMGFQLSRVILETTRTSQIKIFPLLLRK